MIAEGGENRDCVHLEVSKWERSGRGAIWPPKHELGPWRPAMAGMELLRERDGIMHKMELHEVSVSFLEEAVIMQLQ